MKPNSKETCIDLEEDWFPYQTGQTFCQTDQWYFLVSRWRTWSHIWNLEPPSMRALLACNIIRIYLKVEDYKIENKACVDTNTNERKWRQPLLQLHLVTKSCGRWELGLLTSSGAVLSLKKMLPCTMFWSVQTFSVNSKFTERYHIFCARIDLSFYYFRLLTL